MTHHIQLADYVLTKGQHLSPDDGVCLMELVALFAGREHTDRPPCVSRILGTFGRDLNDQLDDVRRQQLKPLIPRLLGTADDGLDRARRYLALDWLIRTYTPAWLDVAGLHAEAARLRALLRIVDLATAKAAEPVVRGVAAKAWAVGAGAAVRDAAGAAWAAKAAWDARDAAGAAWVVGDAAATRAAWAAAWATARDARDVRDAWDRDAWDRDAWAARAWAALKPTIEQLQDSAIDLYTRMITPNS